MKHGVRHGREKPRGALLDAGVALARLDRQHRSHKRVVELFAASLRGDIASWISVVNLAEILEHAHRYSQASGLDPVSLLDAFRIAIHSPDVAVARRVAALASLRGASLADRFAVATAELLGARLYTTDTALAKVLRRHKLPVSLL